MKRGELLAFLCDDPSSDPAVTLDRWMAESRRFYAFAAEYRTKIRKKLLTSPTRESARGVLMELSVARRLLHDTRCAVEYERYGQGGARRPDLTLTFRERSVVDLEVTRIQRPAGERPDWGAKLAGVVCQKLGQMTPDIPNVLIVAFDGEVPSHGSIATAMKRLRMRVEQRDVGVLARAGFADPSAFFRRFERLSAIVVWSPGLESEGASGLWPNPLCRRPLPAAVAALFRGEPAGPPGS